MGIDVKKALEVADSLEALANAMPPMRVPIDEVEPVVKMAKKLLIMRYGIGNRHTVAVAEMYESSLARSANGQIAVGFLRGVAMRIRNSIEGEQLTAPQFKYSRRTRTVVCGRGAISESAPKPANSSGSRRSPTEVKIPLRHAGKHSKSHVGAFRSFRLR